MTDNNELDNKKPVVKKVRKKAVKKSEVLDQYVPPFRKLVYEHREDLGLMREWVAKYTKLAETNPDYKLDGADFIRGRDKLAVLEKKEQSRIEKEDKARIAAEEKEQKRLQKLAEKEAKEKADADAKHIKELEKQEKKTKAELDELEQLEKYKKMVTDWTARLENLEVYYVRNDHCFYEYKPETGQWGKFKVEACHKFYGVTNQLAHKAFDEALRILGRMKEGALYSAGNVDDDQLNFVRKDHWLQPKKGEVHEVFHLLMRSLSDGRQEIADHIEQLIYWKYTHPDDYNIPCLVVTGVGGTGKNTLTLTLRVVWGDYQVVTVDKDKAFGQYNGLLKGKMLVFVDEKVSSHEDANKMKSIVGNKMISINDKYGTQGDVLNTAWYITGGNDRAGAVLLDNTSADRRWSIIKLERDLAEHTMEMYGIEDREEALKHYLSMESVLRDKDEVACWLNYLIEKWEGVCMECPRGYHGEDYEHILEEQKEPWKVFVDEVFVPHFRWIRGNVFYEAYKLWIKTFAPTSVSRMKTKHKMIRETKDYIKKHHPDIEWTVARVGGGTTTTGFVNRAAPGERTAFDNDSTYIKITYSSSGYEQAPKLGPWFDDKVADVEQGNQGKVVSFRSGE